MTGFYKVEDIMDSLIQRFRLDIGHNSINGIFNSNTVAEIRSLISSQLITHPSYDCNLTIAVLFKKYVPSKTEAVDVVDGYFRATSFIATKVSPALLTDQIEDTFTELSEKLEEFQQRGSGLMVENFLYLDIVLLQNETYQMH